MCNDQINFLIVFKFDRGKLIKIMQFQISKGN